MRIMPSVSPGARLLALFFLLASPSLLHAQTFDELGERAQGMGGAFVAVADDATAIYWNPAGLGNVWKFDAQIDLARPSGTTDLPNPGRSAFAGAAIPVLGLAYYQLHTGVPASADRQNEGTGKVHPAVLTTQNFAVSIVQTVVNRLVVGVTPRIVRGPDATVFDLDAGAMMSIGDVRVGLTARNLRQPTFFVPGQAGQTALTRQARIGGAYAPRSLPSGVYGPLSVAFDADLTKTPTPFGDRRRAAVGSEQWWGSGRVGTRAGLQWSTLGASQPAISGGLTVKLSSLAFVEGHVTKGRISRDSDWGLGLRVTF
jgi:hypothetical protein